jgi:predicted phage terminase large subunit-like protein
MSAPAECIRISAQAGPQSSFFESLADIAIYGGAAGSGKTIGLLFEPLKWVSKPGFGGVIFRRDSTQVTKEGGLWDTAERFYPLLGAEPLQHKLLWRFPSGATIGFSHLQYDKDVYGWQGAQIPYIGFDEVTHFTEKMFFYLMTRNRSATGIPGYIRATCNPDPDSWVARFIAWWIDQDTGFPIPERSGVLRWFIRVNDALVWSDTKEELMATYGAEQMPKSVTFIPAKITDNPILMKEDPAYLSNLMAQPTVDRARLLGGNWKVRGSAGMCFQRGWFKVVPFSHVPMNGRTVRCWDKASSLVSVENPDPDWTVGLKVRYAEGIFYVMHMERFRDRPHGVKHRIKNLASSDSTRTEIGLEGDPGSAGDFETAEYITWLAGYTVRTSKPTQKKYERAKPAMTQAEGRKIVLVGDPDNPPSWHEEFLTELENFGDDPDTYAHDDIVDTLADAVNLLALPSGGFTSPIGIMVGQAQSSPFSVDRLTPADLGL